MNNLRYFLNKSNFTFAGNSSSICIFMQKKDYKQPWVSIKSNWTDFKWKYRVEYCLWITIKKTVYYNISDWKDIFVDDIINFLWEELPFSCIFK